MLGSKLPWISMAYGTSIRLRHDNSDYFGPIIELSKSLEERLAA